MKALVILGVVLLSTFSGETDKEVLGVLAESSAHNRESFTIIDCEFELKVGLSETKDDAIRGEFKPETVKTRHGKWLVDGSRVLYELSCDPEEDADNLAAMKAHLRNPKPDPSATKSAISLPAHCSARSFLRDGEYSLKYGSFMGGANLFTKMDADGEGIRVTPFNLDVMGADEYSSPARYLRECLNGRFGHKLFGAKSINGRDLLVVGVKAGPGPDGEMIGPTFGFDPSRGYLAAYHAGVYPHSGKISYEVHILDEKKCSGDRWFPAKVVKIRTPESEGPFQVEFLTVTKLDVDSKPDPERFRLELPRGTQVSVSEKNEWINLRSTEVITSDKFADLHQRMIVNARDYAKDIYPKSQLGANPVSPFRRYFLIINVTVIALLAAFYVYAKRRKQKGTAQ